MTEFAPGLPDPKRFGDTQQIAKDRLLDWVIQEHNARKAGKHFDIRFGDKDLYSWATRKELPGPGGKIQLFQQPLHRAAYADFEGEIPSGYGAGTVRTHDRGKVMVTHADREKIKFILKRQLPENFVMVRQTMAPKGTAGQRRSQGGTWLLMNTTKPDAYQLGEKMAALRPEVELQPQQERVIEKLKTEPGVLVYHGLGSGKTLASIAAGESFPGAKEVIVPASLRENYKKELTKFLKGTPKDYHLQSYNSAIKGAPRSDAALTIFDEAHRMGREGTQVNSLVKDRAGKLLFLTGTPMRNDPSELYPFVRVLAKDRGSPQSQDSFNQAFVGERKISPGLWASMMGASPGTEQYIKNKPILRRLLQNRVDYHPSSGEFPKRKDESIEVEMSSPQTDLYRELLNDNPNLSYKVRNNLPPSKRESVQLNAFLGAVRQVSNNPKAYSEALQGHVVDHSPKLQRMLSELEKGMSKDPNFKGLVYSNYLESGVKPLGEKLYEKGIPYGIYTGELNDRQKKKVVDDYNSGATKVILISGAGAEGLDLKGTKLVQIMEPHWNHARVDQVIGRAIRHRSHAHLPEGEREVKVQKFYSQPRPGFMERSGISKLLSYVGFPEHEGGADAYIQGLADKKQKLMDELLDVLREAGGPPKKTQ